MGDEAGFLDSAIISCIRKAGAEPSLWEKSGLDERFGDHERRRLRYRSSSQGMEPDDWILFRGGSCASRPNRRMRLG